MPNWVRTKTRIEGPEEQIAKVRAMAELARKTDVGFFAQFAPKPEGLDDIQRRRTMPTSSADSESK